jgi:hypothetical protein
MQRTVLLAEDRHAHLMQTTAKPRTGSGSGAREVLRGGTL